MAAKCIDVDLTWRGAGTAELEIGAELNALGWVYEPTGPGTPLRYCREQGMGHDFDYALAEARCVVGRQVAKLWEHVEIGGRRNDQMEPVYRHSSTGRRALVRGGRDPEPRHDSRNAVDRLCAR